ncbi:MAG: NAD(P)/FAD-dependent oxidoreductase [Gemmobacter sp.]|jgi:L-2-hydroxyglutarate oxidase LhgO|nr:NAD(P)/FAD-dependent oxidoreductase [Gemmobacter sp.]
MDQADCIVIGAGVVGLAIARELALAGREVLVLERATRFGAETSARNSGVIHAGLHYPPGSLRARLCLEGSGLLYRYLETRNLPHRRCGKLIVATVPGQIATLARIRAGAEACGAGRLALLSTAEARQMEPALACEAALWSPQTGILDGHAFMTSLLGEAEARGAGFVPRAEVSALVPCPYGIVVETAEGYRLRARVVVNAAGHGAPVLARATAGLAARHMPRAFFARGTYFGLPGKPAFSHLIYPVPETDGAGLGIHLTLDMTGAMRFGPDVEWIHGLDYRLSAARAPEFERAIRRYWPDLPGQALAPASCGIRPKIHGPGTPAADFRIDGPEAHGIDGLVNLFGIESPGLTASLALARLVKERLALW